jgi:hypothetical protein
MIVKRMEDNKLNEKQAIEKATAEKFLSMYNEHFKSNFRIEKLFDSPDVICRDLNTGETLGLEITLLEDVLGDVGWALGRLKLPQPTSGLPARSFDLDTLPRLIHSIIKKRHKDYGSNVALVIRQVSRVPWDFEFELDKIRSMIKLLKNPYDKGIWILSITGEIFRIDN